MTRFATIETSEHIRVILNRGLLLLILVPLRVPILLIVPRLIIAVLGRFAVLILEVFAIWFQNSSRSFVSVVVITRNNKHFVFLVLLTSFLLNAKASDQTFQ